MEPSVSTKTLRILWSFEVFALSSLASSFFVFCILLLHVASSVQCPRTSCGMPQPAVFFWGQIEKQLLATPEPDPQPGAWRELKRLIVCLLGQLMSQLIYVSYFFWLTLLHLPILSVIEKKPSHQYNTDLCMCNVWNAEAPSESWGNASRDRETRGWATLQTIGGGVSRQLVTRCWQNTKP